MRYLGVTKETTNWLLNSPKDCEIISAQLKEIEALVALRKSVFVAGPLRIAASTNRNVIALWNTDYLSASGAEEWGLIDLSHQSGILSNHSILAEAFERSLRVVSQRLRRLLIDGQWYHRSHPNGVQTCLAGRGSVARQQSIAYVEGERAVMCFGPARKLESLIAIVADERDRLADYRETADGVVNAARLRPALESSVFQDIEAQLRPLHSRGIGTETPTAHVPSLGDDPVPDATAYSRVHWTYEEWTKNESGLTTVQRQILESDILRSQPLRITGAAGSGKTLLMQLLAMRILKSRRSDSPVRLFYAVHNSAMKEKVLDRFVTLGADEYLDDLGDGSLHVATLFEFALTEMNIDHSAVINRDAMATKEYQIIAVTAALQATLKQHAASVSKSPLLKQLDQNPDLVHRFAELIAIEIGIAIKGRNLAGNRKVYLESEQPLSRLHGVLGALERSVVFDTYEEYQKTALQPYEVLDSDDIAITLLSRLRTPLWDMKRRNLGFDFLFVDETQLFNENERRVFPLLLKNTTTHVPIALAMDSAQDLNGTTSAGFGVLGIRSIAERELQSVHRSTKSILALAFGIIQRTTDLFGADFPDFTAETVTVIDDNHKLASHPRIARCAAGQSLGKFVVRQVRTLRKTLRQIGVVVHADRYWPEVCQEFQETSLPCRILAARGEYIEPDHPIIVITTPEHVGGQEFDAVIAVGIEQGVVPPSVRGHEGLAVALEQYALRELYLTFTRARYQLVIANSHGSAPSALLSDSIATGLLRTN